MNSSDPLVLMFERLKADAPRLAENTLLENRLMNQLRQQNRPRRLNRPLLFAALLLGLVLAGGGIAMAAGLNPIKFFVFFNNNGTVDVVDENGQSPATPVQVVNNGDGSVSATVELPASAQGQTQTVQLQVVTPDDKKK